MSVASAPRVLSAAKACSTSARDFELALGLPEIPTA
jgi:hypothetical protein